MKINITESPGPCEMKILEKALPLRWRNNIFSYLFETWSKIRKKIIKNAVISCAMETLKN
jgi:hypothetical protein